MGNTSGPRAVMPIGIQPPCGISSAFLIEACGYSFISGGASAAALFEDANWSGPPDASVLALTLGPFSATSAVFEADLPTGRWLMAGSCGSDSQCRPAYPPPRTTAIAKRYAKKRRMVYPARTEAPAKANVLYDGAFGRSERI